MTFKKHLLAIIAIASTAVFTSCWDAEEDQHSTTGYFTVTGNSVTGYTLYQDGGGKILPTAQSVSNITNGKGFGDVERAVLAFQWQEKNLSDDQNTITGAELVGGESIRCVTPLSAEQAGKDGVLKGDSLFAINALNSAWAYRGYLTLIFNGSYDWTDDKRTTYLYPTMNLVYEPTKMVPNELELTLCYNRRAPKGKTEAGRQAFTLSFPISGLEAYVPGKDSVTIKIINEGLTKPAAFKISRDEFVRGNWK